MALATKGKSTQRQSSLNVPQPLFLLPHSSSPISICSSLLFLTVFSPYFLTLSSVCLLLVFWLGLVASHFDSVLGLLWLVAQLQLASSPALQPQLPQRFIKLYNLTPFQLANVVGVLFTFALGQITQNSTGVAATKAIDSQPASSVAGSGSGFATVYVSVYRRLCRCCSLS